MPHSADPAADAAYVVTPPAITALPVQDSAALFPVNRIFCIGRNYAAHAVEMGHDPDREPPFFFLKHASALETSGAFPYPPMTADVHHEIEMVVALGRGGSDIAVADALDHVFGYAVALDMTRRDLQAEAKKAGRPWDVGKAFEGSAPAGPVHPVGAPPASGRIALSLNGQPRQEGDLAQMIWSPAETVAALSRFFTLASGDIILTGTPAGVGPVRQGDRLRAEAAGFAPLEVEVV